VARDGAITTPSVMMKSGDKDESRRQATQPAQA